MTRRLPILIIVPHGGYRAPEELDGYVTLSPQDLFLLADTCANELFAMDDRVASVQTTDISNLFIDIDRHHTEVASVRDGMIKKVTAYNRSIFADGHFPDDIAIANLIRRYYLPVHEAIRKTIESAGIRLIVEAHTMMAVGPPNAPDAGKPRPLVLLENKYEARNREKPTCSESLAQGMKSILEKSMARERESVAGRITVSDTAVRGYLMSKYGRDIPMIRMSVSKALFLNQRYTDIDSMSVSPQRIERLRNMFYASIEQFYARFIVRTRP